MALQTPWEDEARLRILRPLGNVLGKLKGLSDRGLSWENSGIRLSP